MTGLDVDYLEERHSYTELLHWDMIYWTNLDMLRHMHAMGRISSIRLLRIESKVNDDIVR